MTVGSRGPADVSRVSDKPREIAPFLSVLKAAVGNYLLVRLLAAIVVEMTFSAEFAECS